MNRTLRALFTTIECCSRAAKKNGQTTRRDMPKLVACVFDRLKCSDLWTYLFAPFPIRTTYDTGSDTFHCKSWWSCCRCSAAAARILNFNLCTRHFHALQFYHLLLVVLFRQKYANLTACIRTECSLFTATTATNNKIADCNNNNENKLERKKTTKIRKSTNLINRWTCRKTNQFINL